MSWKTPNGIDTLLWFSHLKLGILGIKGVIWIILRGSGKHCVDDERFKLPGIFFIVSFLFVWSNSRIWHSSTLSKDIFLKTLVPCCPPGQLPCELLESIYGVLAMALRVHWIFFVSPGWDYIGPSAPTLSPADGLGQDWPIKSRGCSVPPEPLPGWGLSETGP